MISWQYLAGMIDADGSIGTTRTGAKRNVVGRVMVANTNQEFLYTLKNEFGGTVSIRDKGHKKNWKPFGLICWSNRQAEIILENVLPFLIIKKKQAELCIELIQMRNASKKERYNYISNPVVGLKGRVVAQLKPNIRAREEELSALIKSLNTKGISINEKL